MLPFLKNEKEGSMSESVEPEAEYGEMDAVADDIMSAIESKDRNLLKSALESLKELLKSDDETQDQELLNQ